MESSKTDMKTPEQFNSINSDGKKRINCLSFAIGIEEEKLELDYYGGIQIEDSFTKKLSNYGLSVEQVDSLEQLKGKTGFILYGFYPIRTFFGIEKKDFHVVRVNPDGTLVHKMDMRLPAQGVELKDNRGAIEEYDGENEPIYLFVLREEKNMDIESIRKRADIVLAQMSKVYNSKDISDSDKEALRLQLQRIKMGLSNQGITLNSNEINIVLQQVQTLAREHNIELSL